MLLLSTRGGGKTNCAINLCRYLQQGQFINEIYIITTTFDNNNFEDYLELKDENLFININNTDDLNTSLKIIDDEIKHRLNRWKTTREQYTLKEYNKLYREILKKWFYYEKIKDEIDEQELYEFKLKDDETKILEDNNYQIKQNYYETIPNHLLIIDDIQGMYSNNKKSQLNNMSIRHKHKHLNTIILNQYLKIFLKH